MNQPSPSVSGNESAVKTASLPKAYRFYFFCTLIAGFIGAGFQIFLLISSYDWNIGMYRAGSPAVTVFCVFAAVTVLGILSMPLFFRPKEEIQLKPRSDSMLLMTSFLCGFILLALIVMKFALKIGITTSTTIGNVFSAATLVLILPSAAFFLIPFLKNPPEKAVTALAFFSVLWCGSFLMAVYFDRSCALSSPIRCLTQLSLIASMVYFLSELRFRVGRPKTACYFMFSNLAVFVSLLSAVPVITLSFIQGWNMTNDVLYSAVQLCFLAYIIARVISFLKEI